MNSAELSLEADATVWRRRIQDALDRGTIATAYQPIVDLARGVVVGYEALARFPDGGAPGDWFAAARKLRLTDPLEAACMQVAFDGRHTLPPNCFLTVNVGHDALLSEPVRRVLDRHEDLNGVVLELTEHSRIESYEEVDEALTRYRSIGALIAVDDAGTGYAGMRHLLALRPSIVKLDRHFVVDIDRDEAKRALVEMLGTFTERIDALLLAEGVERVEELDVLVDLRVPLGQGFLLGHPSTPWRDVDMDLAARMIRRHENVESRTVESLVEPRPTVDFVEDAAALFGADEHLDVAVVLDQHDRPVAFAEPATCDLGIATPVLCMNVETTIADATRRAMTRTPDTRFQPIVCVDGANHYLGVVRVERLVDRLAFSANRTG